MRADGDSKLKSRVKDFLLEGMKTKAFKDVPVKMPDANNGKADFIIKNLFFENL